MSECYRELEKPFIFHESHQMNNKVMKNILAKFPPLWADEVNQEAVAVNMMQWHVLTHLIIFFLHDICIAIVQHYTHTNTHTHTSKYMVYRNNGNKKDKS